VYVRKMQACWRWDWGLELMTIGPDRPITLHLADAKFQEVFTKAIVEENMERKLKVDIQVQGAAKDILGHCALIDPQSGKTIKEEEFSVSEDFASLDWDLDSTHVSLWWPNGQGEQKRYRFDCQLKTKVCVFFVPLRLLSDADRFALDHRPVPFWTPLLG
jgi:beta-mannosidase